MTDSEIVKNMLKKYLYIIEVHSFGEMYNGFTYYSKGIHNRFNICTGKITIQKGQKQN